MIKEKITVKSIKVKKIRKVKGEEFCSLYDLGVKNNSNFFIRPKGSKNSILVHNCQGLSPAAKQALLKPIEEPPPSTVWILCTTASEKLPPAIISRCSKMYMNYPDVVEVAKKLKNIAKKEYKPSILKKLNGNYKKIAIANSCQPRNSIDALESVAMAIIAKPKMKIDKIIKDHVTSSGDLTPLVMKFLSVLYKKKIRVPLSIAGKIEQDKVEEFIKLLSLHSHYSVVYLTSKVAGVKVDKGFWGVDRLRWDGWLDKLNLKDYTIPLTVCGSIARGTELVRRGLLTSDQVLLCIIDDFIRERRKS